MLRSRMEMSRGPAMRKRTAMFHAESPGVRRSRYQSACCAMVVGKAYSGSERLRLGSLGCGYGNRLPIGSSLSGGCKLIALARNGENLFRDVLRRNLFCRRLIPLGGYRRDGAKAEELLRRDSDSGAGRARDNLEKVQGISAEIEETLEHTDSVQMKHFGADGRELLFCGRARSNELFLVG